MSKFNKVLLAGSAMAMVVMVGANAEAKVNQNTTEVFTKVKQIVLQQDKKYKTSNVLVVFDIDNTLLTATKDLGSDVWYQWQTGKLKVKATKSQKVPCLYSDTIGLLYELLPMKLTAKNVPTVLNLLQKRKQPMFALTSRSPDYRTATERELKRNGLSFIPTALSYANNKELLLRGKFSRPYSYMDGIMMTTGGDKGKMLDYILTTSKRKYKSIVFVDDGLSNIQSVAKEFALSKYKSVDTQVVYFTKIEKQRMKKFGAIVTKKQASIMDRKWKKLERVLNTIYPARKGVCLTK